MISSAEPQPQAQARGPGGWERFGRWLGKKTNLGFIFVALLALMTVVYRIMWGLSPTISGEVFGLLGILILIGIFEMADITRYFAPPAQALRETSPLPPLGLAEGSVRAMLTLLILGLWTLLLFLGSRFIADANILDKALTSVGALVLTIIGFYFGSRTSQERKP